MLLQLLFGVVIFMLKDKISIVKNLTYINFSGSCLVNLSEWENGRMGLEYPPKFIFCFCIFLPHKREIPENLMDDTTLVYILHVIFP